MVAPAAAHIFAVLVDDIRLFFPKRSGSLDLPFGRSHAHLATGLPRSLSQQPRHFLALDLLLQCALSLALPTARSGMDTLLAPFVRRPTAKGFRSAFYVTGRPPRYCGFADCWVSTTPRSRWDPGGTSGAPPWFVQKHALPISHACPTAPASLAPTMLVILHSNSNHYAHAIHAPTITAVRILADRPRDLAPTLRPIVSRLNSHLAPLCPQRPEKHRFAFPAPVPSDTHPHQFGPPYAPPDAPGLLLSPLVDRPFARAPPFQSRLTSGKPLRHYNISRVT